MDYVFETNRSPSCRVQGINSISGERHCDKTLILHYGAKMWNVLLDVCDKDDKLTFYLIKYGNIVAISFHSCVVINPSSCDINKERGELHQGTVS